MQRVRVYRTVSIPGTKYQVPAISSSDMNGDTSVVDTKQRTRRTVQLPITRASSLGQMTKYERAAWAIIACFSGVSYIAQLIYVVRLPGVRYGHTIQLICIDIYAWHVLFCKSYISYYMFVGGELYLIALPHTIPHMVSKKSNMYGVAPVTLMHVSRRVRWEIFIWFFA